MSLSSDLKDMSPMVLTCDGPDKFFDSHKLVLNVPFSDSKRVGVFCAQGECTGGASSHPDPSSAYQILSFLVYISPFFPSLFVTLTTTYKQTLHQDTTYYPRNRFDNYFHFTEGKTEAQRHEFTVFRSHTICVRTGLLRAKAPPLFTAPISSPLPSSGQSV